MESFRVPSFLRIRPRRSFRRLRSFHLSPTSPTFGPKAESLPVDHHREESVSSHLIPSSQQPNPKQTHPVPAMNGFVALDSKTLVILAVLFSLIFIGTISCAFAGVDADEPYFARMLDSVAETTPGLVLMGDSVDVDIDEPSVTIRWSILACGEEFMLPNSAGSHGSDLCGLPAFPLQVFVDSDSSAAASYDPSNIPFKSVSGDRRSIQNLVQFDSDHVLDVHEANRYPFDKYLLTSTIRAVSMTGNINQTIPIRKLATIAMMSSFSIETNDMDSYTVLSTVNGTTIRDPSRDIDVRISRPGGARFFALLIFGISWMLTHITVGHVIVVRMMPEKSTEKSNPIFGHLIFTGAILVALPQMRNSMPDAPDLDGVLIDCIGYFPQMIISGISFITILLAFISREFESLHSSSHSPPSLNSNVVSKKPRPPSPPSEQSSSEDIAQYENYRRERHKKGYYVFPPVTSISIRLPEHLQRRVDAGTLPSIV